MIRIDILICISWFHSRSFNPPTWRTTNKLHAQLNYLNHNLLFGIVSDSAVSWTLLFCGFFSALLQASWRPYNPCSWHLAWYACLKSVCLQSYRAFLSGRFHWGIIVKKEISVIRYVHNSDRIKCSMLLLPFLASKNVVFCHGKFIK